MLARHISLSTCLVCCLQAVPVALSQVQVPELSIVFAGRIAPGEPNDLFACRPDGTNLRNLTASFAGRVETAHISPSGATILFTAASAGGWLNLHVMNSDGTNIRVLTNLQQAYGPVGFGWLDERTVIYRWAPGASQGDIHALNIETGQDTLLVPSMCVGQHSIDHASVSPDGTRIAFTAQRGSWSPTTDVYVFDRSSGTCGTIHEDSPDNFVDATVAWLDASTVCWSHNSVQGLASSFHIVCKTLSAAGGPVAVTTPQGGSVGVWDVLPYTNHVLFSRETPGLRIFNADNGSETIIVPNASVSMADCGILTPPPECGADFNHDGGTDGTDVEAFFAVWQNGGC